MTRRGNVTQYGCIAIGHQHGGFGALKVLRHAPTQTSLQGMPA